ncbi:MAG TPA: M20/M25/M40 family metallo-hydrolase [Roseiflexaceae bacterium]|nr:M20/M25/M40 family metallo-hydrolase [Roseiflexaceae bacterium]
MSDQTLRDELTALTCDLVAIPSIDTRPDALRAVIDYAEQYARAIDGLHITAGEQAGKPYLIATLHDTRAPDLMLNAHLDVVPGRAEQFQPRIENGRIYGRATQDMKGSGAVLLRLMKDLATLDTPPNVGFMFVSDEEIGGEEGVGYLAEQGWNCKLFIAAEPTDLQICYAHKGAMWVEVHFEGQPAHGSRPWEGRNVILDLRDGLVAMEERFPNPTRDTWRTTVTPTIVQGGEAGNRLPENVVLTLDIRFVPEDQPDDIMAGLRECFPHADVRLLRSGPPLDTDPEHPTVRRLAGVIADVTGAPAGFYHEHFATDARFYSVRGVPAVCVGPVGAGLHSDEEWVDIASLEQLYEIFRRFATQS